MTARSRTGIALGIVLVMILSASAIGLVGSAAAQPVGTAVAPPRIAYVNLTISSSSGMHYVYVPNVASVPVGTTVLFRIANYDPRVGPLLVPTAGLVTGTIGGKELLIYGHVQAYVGQVPAGMVSHTFTFLGPGVRLNVPIPPAMNPLAPTVVVFSVVFPAPSQLPWTSNVFYPQSSPLAGILTAT